MVWIFPDDFQFSELFQNCPDFPRWLPIFRIISKLSGFFQMTANFPDYFKTVRIFPDDCLFSRWYQNCPDFSRWLPIFWTISKVSWFFQIQMVTPHAVNFVLQTNFCLGGRGPQNSAKKNCAKNRYLGRKPPFFHIFQPFLVHFMTFVVHF